MDTEQITPTDVNVSEQLVKQVWETPELRSIELEGTESGPLPGLTENETYADKS